jgi:hypothetical protein
MKQSLFLPIAIIVWLSLSYKRCSMKTLCSIAIVTSPVLLMTSGCIHAIHVDETYKGRIIDAETKKPIEGVVVLGTWYTAQFSPAGPTHNFYDARETVTDRNGEFLIPGMGLRIMSNLEPMHVLIFKAGYEYLNVPWVSLKKDILLREKIKWQGSKAIIPLRRLTMEDRKKSQTFPPYPPSSAPKEIVKLMMEEIYKESTRIGLERRNRKGEKKTPKGHFGICSWGFYVEQKQW